MPSVLKENTAKPEGATSPWDGLILIAPTWTAEARARGSQSLRAAGWDGVREVTPDLTFDHQAARITIRFEELDRTSNRHVRRIDQDQLRRPSATGGEMGKKTRDPSMSPRDLPPAVWSSGIRIVRW